MFKVWCDLRQLWTLIVTVSEMEQYVYRQSEKGAANYQSVKTHLCSAAVCHKQIRGA